MENIKKAFTQTITKALAVLLIAIMLLTYTEFFSNAENEVYNHECYLKEHFSWIQEDNTEVSDYPKNPFGSCSYVAMSLLLSYYDAYWDDRFVPIDYEIIGEISPQSSKIWSDFHFTLENTEWEALIQENGWNLNEQGDKIEAAEVYSQFIQDHSDKYFQLYLLSLAIQEGYHDNELSYGLYPFEIVDFLEFYLYEKCGFNSNQVTVHELSESLTTTNEDLFDMAKEHIKSGFPVIYGGTKIELENVEWLSSIKDNVGGHALVGYDVTENEDDIILSYCWNGYDTTTFYKNEYKYFSSIIWLEINEDELPHTCSESYRNLADTRGYCICELYSKHPNHRHVSYYGGEECPMSSKNYTCYCGELITASHTYNIEAYSSTQHWIECACGAKSQLWDHDIAYTHTSVTHSGACECGYTIVDQPHQFTEFTNISNLYHKAYCTCGYYRNEMHVTRSINNRYSECTICGAVFDMWSTPTIKGENDPPKEME